MSVNWIRALLLTAGLSCSMTGFGMQALTIIDQGVFAVGGTVVKTPGTFDPYHPEAQGQTLHGDHAVVRYQIPAQPRDYPLVFLHGYGQYTKTWETTPDGRDGFSNIFLSAGYPVYLMDQPRRGDAGRATRSYTIEAATDDQFWFGQFRMGVWPEFYPGSQFPQDAAALDQFFRQITPNTGEYEPKVVVDALCAVFNKIGPAVLVTHSQGGGLGWLAGLQSPDLKGIVSYEPGADFPFPEGEVPEPVANSGFFGPQGAVSVPLQQFMHLTRYPIVIYYGDFIPKEPSANPYADFWRAAVTMAHKWADCVNRHGGDVTVIELPAAGIKGNSHFAFAEKNNQEVAALLQRWLEQKGLASRKVGLAD